MLRSPSVVVLLVVALVFLSPLGLDPKGGPNSAPTSPNLLPATVESDATPLPVGIPVEPLGASANVLVTLTLASPRPAAEASFLTAVEDPSSPLYHHYLSYSGYLAEFAPSPSVAAIVQGTLASYGGRSVTVFPDRSAVTALLTPAEVRALFGVQLVVYGRAGATPIYTAEGALSLPPPLRGLVTGVSGLSDAEASHFSLNLAASGPRPLRSSSGPGSFIYNTSTEADWAVGSDYTDIFGATELFPGAKSVPNATFPEKVAIATVLASGYNETVEKNLPPWDPAVVESYFNTTLAPTWPLPVVSGVPVAIGGVEPPLPGSFGALNDSTLDEYENSLDLEMAGSMAPGATVVNFYLPGSVLASQPPYSSLADDFALALAQALAYNYSPARLAVVSCSFGLPDLNDSAWDQELELAAATGVTVVAASGDQGNSPNSVSGSADGPWPVWPASAAFNTSGALSVGGVSLSFSGAPTGVYNGSGPLSVEYDSNITGVTNLSAWYDDEGAAGVAGTEGGASEVFAEPYWQFHSAAQPAIRNATVLEGASRLGRSEPDLALSANRTIAWVSANSAGVTIAALIEGTSIAAPLMAGLLADLVAVESNRSSAGWAPLGFVDPEIYRIASYYAAHPSDPTDPFTEVTQGNNYFFSAAPGWDALTGWGTVNALLLLAANGNSTVSGYSYTGPTPGLPPQPSSSSAVPWTAIYVIFGIGMTAALVLVVVSARPRRPRRAPTVPYGAQGSFPPGAQGGIYPGATFLCPYCGAIRPAEPVRCPQCGAL